MSKSAVFGLISGITVVILTLIVVALVNLPEAEGAGAQRIRRGSGCHGVPVAQDQGYEITRMVIRKVCESTSPE